MYSLVGGQKDKLSVSLTLTLSRVLNGAVLSSCSRFPMIGRAGGPGGKQYCLLLFRLKSHSKVQISTTKITVPENSIMLHEKKIFCCCPQQLTKGMIYQ